MIKQLMPGEVYEIWHTRKGRFVAKLIAVEPADKGDESDSTLLHVVYDVRVGTDQIGLSMEYGKQAYRESRLRPSLITKIEHLEGENWLRDVKLPEAVQTSPPIPLLKERGVVDKIKDLFRR